MGTGGVGGARPRLLPLTRCPHSLQHPAAQEGAETEQHQPELRWGLSGARGAAGAASVPGQEGTRGLR